MTGLLESIDDPTDLRKLNVRQLTQVAAEVRELIIEVVSRNRGHLASNLGTVELTLALHYCFDFRHDRLVWDCGHQCYAHKILTGRRDAFRTLRQEGGISGFADRSESPYDTFSFGHTGTSISAALGIACGQRAGGKGDHVVAVIGDGAIASGMPFEALNHAGELGGNLIVVLNDNTMSISPSVGAVARHLSKLRVSPSYDSIRQEVMDLANRVPVVGPHLDVILARLTEGVQAALTPGGLFVELGFRYFGPMDGHNIPDIVETFRNLKRMRGPILLHMLTEKGHGFRPASQDPTRFHSSKRFEWANGTLHSEEETTGDSYSNVFARALCDLGESDSRIVAITAAMPDGTGLTSFAERFGSRFYDVGICEQHAVGLAAGLSAGSLRPVFAVYSTFLQRAYDQLFHDISLQGEPAVFCIDRAGLVGTDGSTHHGLHDIAYCRALPGFVLMAPATGAELRRMLELALKGDFPAAIRYPREKVPDPAPDGPVPDFEVGRAEVRRRGPDGAIIAYGVMAARASAAARILREEDGLDITVINARFARPLDLDVIAPAVAEHPAVLLVEDHCVAGGFGSAVLEGLAERGVGAGHVRLLGVPCEPVRHASRESQLAAFRLDAGGQAGRLRELRRELGLN